MTEKPRQTAGLICYGSNKQSTTQRTQHHERRSVRVVRSCPRRCPEGGSRHTEHIPETCLVKVEVQRRRCRAVHLFIGAPNLAEIRQEQVTFLMPSGEACSTATIGKPSNLPAGASVALPS